MAEPIIKAKLVLDTAAGTSAAGPQAGGGGGLAGAFGGAGGKGLMGTLGKLTGAVGAILTLLEAYKAPLMILGQIGKVLSLFLKPFADLWLIILKPILLFLVRLLVPFLQMWNKILPKLDAIDVAKLIVPAFAPIITAFELLTGGIEPFIEKMKDFVTVIFGEDSLTMMVLKKIADWIKKPFSIDLGTLIVQKAWEWVTKGWEAITAFPKMIFEAVSAWISNNIRSVLGSLGIGRRNEMEEGSTGMMAGPRGVAIPVSTGRRSGSTTINNNVTVNAPAGDEGGVLNVARIVADKLAEISKRELSGRSSYGVSGSW